MMKIKFYMLIFQESWFEIVRKENKNQQNTQVKTLAFWHVLFKQWRLKNFMFKQLPGALNRTLRE